MTSEVASGNLGCRSQGQIISVVDLLLKMSLGQSEDRVMDGQTDCIVIKLAYSSLIAGQVTFTALNCDSIESTECLAHGPE